MVRSTLLKFPYYRPFGDSGVPTSLYGEMFKNRILHQVLQSFFKKYDLGIVQNSAKLHRKVIKVEIDMSNDWYEENVDFQNFSKLCFLIFFRLSSGHSTLFLISSARSCAKQMTWCEALSLNFLEIFLVG